MSTANRVREMTHVDVKMEEREADGGGRRCADQGGGLSSQRPIRLPCRGSGLVQRLVSAVRKTGLVLPTLTDRSYIMLAAVFRSSRVPGYRRYTAEESRKAILGLPYTLSRARCEPPSVISAQRESMRSRCASEPVGSGSDRLEAQG